MRWVLCMHENINKSDKIVPKHILLYNVLFWYCITIMYNKLYMQYLLKVDGLMVKWIFIQHIFILYDTLSENFIRYSFVHFKLTWVYVLGEPLLSFTILSIMSYVISHPFTFSYIFETTWQMLMKLCKDVHCMKPRQTYSKYSIPWKTIVAMATIRKSFEGYKA